MTRNYKKVPRIIDLLDLNRGCAEVDFLIAEYLGLVPEHIVHEGVGTPYGWFRGPDDWALWKTKESDPYAGIDTWRPKRYSRSVDDALELVESLGYELISIEVHEDIYWVLMIKDGIDFYGSGKTIPIATLNVFYQENENADDL